MFIYHLGRPFKNIIQVAAAGWPHSNEQNKTPFPLGALDFQREVGS